MNWSLKQRILRHVRIHGGDSNALARAMHCGVQKDTLMTNEKGLFAQAGLRNVRGSTIERKIMSTKTTTKRISLVAALALGLGVLTSVSANATVTAATSFINAGTGATTAANFATSTSVAVGTRATVDLTSGFTAGGADAVTLTAVLTSSPAAVAGTSANAIGAAGGATFTTVGSVTNGAASGANDVRTITATGSGAVTTIQTLGYTPTVAGVYVITTTLAAGTVLTNGSLTHVWTIYAGYGIDALNPTRAFPTQGSNITTGWSTTTAGVGTVRLTNYPHAASVRHFVTVTGGTIVTATVNGAATSQHITKLAPTDATAAVNLTNGSNFTGGVDYYVGTASTASESVDIQVQAGTVGNVTVTDTYYDATTGASTVYATAVLTVGIASAASTQYSLLTLNAGALTTATGSAADTKLTTVATTAGTKQFTIEAVLNDQYNVAINGLTLGASIAGPGTIGIATTTASTATSAGRSLTVALTGTNLGHVTVFGDGTAGASTITITATNSAGVTTILGTKAVTFVGSPAKATVAQSLYIAKAGTPLGETPTTSIQAQTTVATTPAFTATVVDSAGVKVVAGSTVKMTSSNTAVITGGSCAELTVDGDSTATVTPAPGVFECSVSGAAGAASGSSATITFSVLDATTGLYDIVAAPITFKIGGSIAAVSVALDKTSYAPGAAMNLTATAKDSTGNLAYDGQSPYITANPSSNMSLITLPTTAAQIVNGVYSTTSAGVASLFAPASTGDLTISGTAANTATAGVPFTASAKIVNSTDAAIASLLTKINALAALIAKIQKKLGVK